MYQPAPPRQILDEHHRRATHGAALARILAALRFDSERPMDGRPARATTDVARCCEPPRRALGRTHGRARACAAPTS